MGREAENLANRLEHLVADGLLCKHEVFLIKDSLPLRGPTTRAIPLRGNFRILSFESIRHSVM